MKKHSFKSEEEFAEIIVKWLKHNGWEVYQEVQPYQYGNTADIVAEKERKYWIIECKLNFGFAVMAQADRWNGHANYVSIAVPLTKANPFKRKICELLNIGVLRVSKDWYKENEFHINEYLEPKEHELELKGLINSLTEKHKTYAKAGNNYGKRITPFKLTVEKLIEYVKNNNGTLLKEAIKNIQHHYSTNNSANGSLANFINTDIIKELYLDRTKEGNRVYLKENKNEKKKN